MMVFDLRLCCLLAGLSFVHAASTGYDMILTIVIVEVIFSFMIGVVCIVLSFNLFRAMKDSPESYTGLPAGEFPLSLGRGVSYNVLNNGDDSSELGRSSTPRTPTEREGSFSLFIIDLFQHNNIVSLHENII